MIYLNTPFSYRQERLEQLSEKFERKATLRESWLNDMTLVLSDQNFGSSTSQVEASLKKHEAISADIESRVSSIVNKKIRSLISEYRVLLFNFIY